MREVRLTIRDISDSNRKVKFTRAVGSLAKAMGVPLTVRQRERERGEKFVYAAEEELVQQWGFEFADTLDSIYVTLCVALDLPKVTTFTKAIDNGIKEMRPVSEALWYRGKIVYNPETGFPIYREDFEKILRAIEKFLNRRLDKMGKHIVLHSVALGRVLARKLLTIDPAEVRKLKLSEVKHEDKPIEWMAESLERQNRLLGPLHPEERERLSNHYKKISTAVEIAEQSMGDHITQMEDSTLHAVRRSIIDGIKGRKSKTEVAQELFNRFGNLNRDWQRIAETETVSVFNNAFLRETVATAAIGEKVYFKRVEMRDQFVCKFCEKIRDQIVLWVESPLLSEKIDDPVAKVAIWEGKNNVGRKAKDYRTPAEGVHPYCRGSWQRYFPPKDKGQMTKIKDSEQMPKTVKNGGLQ